MSARALSAVLVMAAIILFVGCGQENTAETAATGGAATTTSGTSGANGAMLPKPRPAPTAELPDPVVTMHTSLGDVLIRLNQKAAPRTVSNFVDYVLTKHYDGTIIHQIDAGYALIGGTYTDKLVQKPVRYPIANESANGLKNRRGTIAMLRNPADPNSATSQYFINLADNPKLDRTGDKPEEAGYCVFGEVIQGLDVLEKISQVRTADVKGFTKLPTQTVLVQSMSVVR
jgi:cyclophilin family peptidyl-prolyl cis-trans isomerase